MTDLLHLNSVNTRMDKTILHIGSMKGKMKK